MSSSLRILFHLPTRSRPERAREAIQNIIDNCEDSNYLILVSCDVDDTTMHDFKFIHPKVLIHWGKSNNKIHACNRSIHLIADWDILVASSDDMRFQVKGFDDVIRGSFYKISPDASTFKGLPYDTFTKENDKQVSPIDLKQFIHFSDGNQGANVCTLSVIGREYYALDNYVYHPEYENLWCDVEATEVAKLRGCYKYMGNDLIIVKHMHPAWGLAPMDGQYLRQDNLQTSSKDKATYERRKEMNFGL